MFQSDLRFYGALLGLAMGAASVWAGCKTDCKMAYESEVQECHAQYEDPDDADELKQCIEEAKNTYDDCIDECEN